jgi:hypothetical protein
MFTKKEKSRLCSIELPSAPCQRPDPGITVLSKDDPVSAAEPGQATQGASMIRSFLVTISLTLCWALSPEVLVLLGNSVGQGGMLFFAALFLGAAFSAMAANILHHPFRSPVDNDHRDILSSQIGPFLAMTLTLAGRLSPVLLLSTGMLVTAGFTFNETFVYWFPNFGFSFFLLFMVLVLHLFGNKVVLTAQSVFFCLAACCLLILSIAGLMTEPPVAQPVNSPAETGPTFFLSFICLSLLLFLGYDQQPLHPATVNSSYFLAAIGIGFLLLVVWGLASLRHVPQARLAESTVPYIIGAKAILGQTGRILMGIAIISGACGAVSGLFYLSGRSLSQVLPGIVSPKIQAILMTLAIVLFLAGGLAGSNNLETYIFGALLLWLLTISANCLAIARENHLLHGYAVGMLLLAAAAYLAFIYPHPWPLGRFCLLVLVVSASFSAALCGLSRNQRNLTAINSKGGKT